MGHLRDPRLPKTTHTIPFPEGKRSITIRDILVISGNITTLPYLNFPSPSIPLLRKMQIIPQPLPSQNLLGAQPRLPIRQRQEEIPTPNHQRHYHARGSPQR